MRNVLSGMLIVVAIGALASELEQRPVVANGTSWRDAGASRPSGNTVVSAELGEALIIPVAGVRPSQLRSSFNEGRVGHLHHAIDILAPRGTPVLAAVDGVVKKLFFSRDGGITLYEFDRTATHSYYYAHLDGYAAGIREGLAVHRGDLLGYVGTTGNAPATTPHLHFGIYNLPAEKLWWKGEAIDPYPILTANGVPRVAAALP